MGNFSSDFLHPKLQKKGMVMNRNPKEKHARIEIRVKPADKEKIKRIAEVYRVFEQNAEQQALDLRLVLSTLWEMTTLGRLLIFTLVLSNAIVLFYFEIKFYFIKKLLD